MKGRRTVVAVPLLLLLLVWTHPVAVPHDSPSATAGVPKLDLLYQLQIPHGYFEYLQVDLAAQSNVLAFGSMSNVSISTSLMNAAQFKSFNETESGIVNSLYINNGTSTLDTQSNLVEGDYFLVFLAYSANANISYNYQAYPNSPFQSGDLPAPEPTGVATFGLDNNSGTVTPYEVESGEIVGVADISSLMAHNSSASSAESNVSGATLQLNSILVVNETGGSQQVYWVQDTPDFVTSASQVAYGDNVWNYSVSGFLSNSTITSNVGGYTSTYTQNGQPYYYYAYEASNSTYALPFDLALLMNATAVPGTGVTVDLGTEVLRNGSAPASPVDWFDTITIHDPTVQSTYFLVAGNSTTPNYLFYDTELTFGGESDGEATNFTQMSASLQLLYDSNSTGMLTYFPSYYSFGQDTAESADNLQVSYSGNGVAQISTGTPNYVYLGAASGSFSLSQLAAQAASSTLTTSSQSTSSSSSGVSSLPLSYLAVVATALAVIAGAEISRRMRSSRPGPSSEAGYSG